ncbi:MAG TPA: cystathionine beta-lyase [Rhizomicrobium sp.]
MSGYLKHETLAVQAGRMSEEHFGAVNTPVYRASTMLCRDLSTLEAGHAPYVYGRLGTPSSRSLQEAIMALEQGAATVVCPSGLNAIATAIMAVCGAGDHFLVVDSCYGPTRNFCDKALKRAGVETTYYDPLTGTDIERLIRPNTKAVYCESPGSLTFEMQDIPAIAAVAHAHGASVLLDNTWATPVLFHAFAHGVDISIQSITKYIGGHSDLVMGCATANAAHKDRLEEVHFLTGACAGADDCFLALRGLRTLSVRLRRHEKTALELSRWLNTRPEVERILHPALEDDPGHAIWRRDFNGSSGLFGVVLKPIPHAALAAFIDGLSHFGLGYSWGGFESLIVPAHIVRTAQPFAAEGPLVRIHAGLEDADDLIADLEVGFGRMNEAQ